MTTFLWFLHWNLFLIPCGTGRAGSRWKWRYPRQIFSAAEGGLLWAILLVSLPSRYSVRNGIFGDFPDSWREQGIIRSVALCEVSHLFLSLQTAVKPLGSHHLAFIYRNSAQTPSRMLKKTDLFLWLDFPCIRLVELGQTCNEYTWELGWCKVLGNFAALGQWWNLHLHVYICAARDAKL